MRNQSIEVKALIFYAERLKDYWNKFCNESMEIQFKTEEDDDLFLLTSVVEEKDQVFLEDRLHYFNEIDESHEDFNCIEENNSRVISKYLCFFNSCNQFCIENLGNNEISSFPDCTLEDLDPKFL